MEISLAATFAFLLLAAALGLALRDPAAESPEGHDQPIPRPVHCCLEYTSTPIPQHLLVRYERADSSCPKPAVIFITKRNREVCANPAEKWVQDRMRRLPPPE